MQYVKVINVKKRKTTNYRIVHKTVKIWKYLKVNAFNRK